MTGLHPRIRIPSTVSPYKRLLITPAPDQLVGGEIRPGEVRLQITDRHDSVAIYVPLADLLSGLRELAPTNATAEDRTSGLVMAGHDMACAPHRPGPGNWCPACPPLNAQESEMLCLTQRELEDLPDYSCSLPTGTTIGKRWRRRVDYHDESKGWLVGEYVEHPDPDLVGIAWHMVAVVR